VLQGHRPLQQGALAGRLDHRLDGHGVRFADHPVATREDVDAHRELLRPAGEIDRLGRHLPQTREVRRRARAHHPFGVDPGAGHRVTRRRLPGVRHPHRDLARPSPVDAQLEAARLDGLDHQALLVAERHVHGRQLDAHRRWAGARQIDVQAGARDEAQEEQVLRRPGHEDSRRRRRVVEQRQTVRQVLEPQRQRDLALDDLRPVHVQEEQERQAGGQHLQAEVVPPARRNPHFSFPGTAT
jgi:hypothetical protein